ncbi:MAG TPA: carbohydrate ABC transporter permease [Actinomycetota bacterium]|nr:carbohydrate ABC transporter permease [Actinomycetota bacterium]
MSPAGRAVRTTAIVLLSASFLAPVVVMVLGSLRDPTLAPPRGLELVPARLRWANYRDVFAFAPLWTYMRNSVAVAVVAVPVTVLVASWAGFAIVRARPRVRRRLIAASVVALMVPTSALLVPRFVVFRWLGLLDSPWPLIAPALMATTPFYVLLFALVYARIPRSLFEAAEVDGLSPLQTWKRVAFPLGRPATFAVAVLAFVWHWSNFFDPLLYLSTPERFTLPLGLRMLGTLEPQLYPIMLAGAVVATGPAVIAFLLAQRAFFARTLDV